MIPASLLLIAPLVASMRIVVAELPDGSVERVRFVEAEGGVTALVERRPARSDVLTHRQVLIPRGSYSWRIVEEKRTVLMATPGRPTGVVRRAFGVMLFSDRRDPRSVMPNPVETFRFYAPTREAAADLRDDLKRKLGR